MTKLSEFEDSNDKKCLNDNDKIRLVIPGKLSSIGVQLILSTNDRAAPRAEANNLYKCQRIRGHFLWYQVLILRSVTTFSSSIGR